LQRNVLEQLIPYRPVLPDRINGVYLVSLNEEQTNPHPHPGEAHAFLQIDLIRPAGKHYSTVNVVFECWFAFLKLFN